VYISSHFDELERSLKTKQKPLHFHYFGPLLFGEVSATMLFQTLLSVDWWAQVISVIHRIPLRSSL